MQKRPQNPRRFRHQSGYIFLAIAILVAAIMAYRFLATNKRPVASTTDILKLAQEYATVRELRIRPQIDCAKTLAQRPLACFARAVPGAVEVLDRAGKVLIAADSQNPQNLSGRVRLRAFCQPVKNSQDSLEIRVIRIEARLEDKSGEPLVHPITKRRMAWVDLFNPLPGQANTPAPLHIAPPLRNESCQFTAL